jgi:hypothetical protein
MTDHEDEKKWATTLELACLDATFRREFLADPTRVLGRIGLLPPEGAKFAVMEIGGGDGPITMSLQPVVLIPLPPVGSRNVRIRFR